MIYAQISGGVVQNVIVLNDPSLNSLFAVGYDYCLRIDDIADVNGNLIGIFWTYDGTSFYPPTE